MLSPQIDTSYSVATPEGISLHLTPAGPVPRIYAWGIDVLIRLIIYAFFGFFSNLLGNFGVGIYSIVVFFIEWFYPVYFEIFRNGQTPGKKMFEIYVAQESGAPVSFGSSMVRNIIRFIDFLPILYGSAFVSMILSDKFQRLGDLAANTVVLYLPTENSLIVENKELDKVPSEHAQVSFSLKEQQALISFSNRMGTLNEDRSDELASLTGDLVKDQSHPSRYLYAIANGLMGKRTHRVERETNSAKEDKPQTDSNTQTAAQTDTQQTTADSENKPAITSMTDENPNSGDQS